MVSGFPSIDRPHRHMYLSSPYRVVNAEQDFYDFVFESNKNNMDSIALKYLGCQISFSGLQKMTDKVVYALCAAGVLPGDVVLIGISNCPEMVALLLAINKIGAISKWFDVRAGENDIKDYANSSSCRILVVFDMLLPAVSNIIHDTCLEKVLVMTPADSLPIVKRMGYRLFKIKRDTVSLLKDPCFSWFSDFINTGSTSLPSVKYEKDRPAVIVQSSGTTGKPKNIVHSCFSVTSGTEKFTHYDLPVKPFGTSVNALPPWIAYALGSAVLYPLCQGCTVILCPSFEPDVLMPYLGQFDISMAAPFHYRFTAEHLLSSKKHMSGKEVLVSGGDKMPAEENARLEQVLGCTLVNGYGNNEGWGALTVNPAHNNHYGTVGIPRFGDVLISYDNDNKCELPYGQIGEICVLTDSHFSGYQANPELDGEMLKMHEDGNIWLHTGDLGYVDTDGYLTLNGRLRRVIIRRGFKISAYTIEDKICEFPHVKECVAVAVEDEAEEHVPMAFVVLDEPQVDHVLFKRELVEALSVDLKSYEIPKYIEIVESLPYTTNNKYDFRLLETMGNDLVKCLSK